MAKKKLVYQTAGIRDMLNELLQDFENGDLMISSMRTFANMESGDGGIYSFALIATCDDDNIAFNYDIPLVDVDLLQQGKGIILAPEGHLPSSKKVKTKRLNFPERG